MRIGIDLGGTKTELVALAPEGAVLWQRRIPTPAAQGYGAIVEAIQGLVLGAERELGARGTVGVGMPGAPSRATGLIKNANTTCLIGRPFQHDLAEALQRPVRLANDANCFALSEASDGAGRGAAAVFGVILGTGCGGGVVVHGRVWDGANSIAGEWGHNPLPWPTPDELPGPACYCGKRGCVETFLSGPGFARDYTPDPKLRAEEIIARASHGEPAASACLGRYCERLAKALAVVVNVLDPEVIVLGGGMSQIEALYHEVPARWGRYVFSDRVDTRLVRAQHGDASGVRGAAWLWSLDEARAQLSSVASPSVLEST